MASVLKARASRPPTERQRGTAKPRSEETRRREALAEIMAGEPAARSRLEKIIQSRRAPRMRQQAMEPEAEGPKSGEADAWDIPTFKKKHAKTNKKGESGPTTAQAARKALAGGKGIGSGASRIGSADRKTTSSAGVGGPDFVLGESPGESEHDEPLASPSRDDVREADTPAPKEPFESRPTPPAVGGGGQGLCSDERTQLPPALPRLCDPLVLSPPAPDSDCHLVPRLPIHLYEAEILEAARHRAFTLVTGPAGCGKTTQVPLFLLHAGVSPPPRLIAVTEPRRVAAIASARRAAEELGDPGATAYCVRFESSGVGPRCRLVFMTDGVLIREIQADPLLRRFGAIVIDEAHERTLNTDVLLGLLSRLTEMRARRLHDPLPVLIMSATLDAARLLDNRALFPRPERVTHVQVEGREHTLRVRFLRRTPSDRDRRIDLVVRLVARLHRKMRPSHGHAGGDVLVFVPTRREAEEIKRRVADDTGAMWDDEADLDGDEPADPDVMWENIGMEDPGDAAAQCLHRMRGRNMLQVLDQMIDQNPSREIVQDTSQMIDQNPSREIVQDTSQMIDQNTSREIVQDTSQMIDQNTSREIVQDTSQMIDQNTSREIAQDTSQMIDQNTSREIAQDTSQMIDQNPSREIVQDTSQMIDQNTSREIAQDTSQMIDQNTSRAIAQNLVQDLSLEILETAQHAQTTNSRPLYPPPKHEPPPKPPTILCTTHAPANPTGPQRRPLQTFIFTASTPHALRSAILAPHHSAARRLILATNVAETTLTVPGVSAVIDTGLVKRARLHAETGRTERGIFWVSQASADQRAGRAARMGPGTAYRLYSMAWYGKLAPHDPPAIAAADLSGVALALARVGIPRLDRFPFPVAPEPARLRAALRKLQMLGALDDRGAITAHGRRIANIPLEPGLAAMALGAPERSPAATAALLLAAAMTVFPADRQRWIRRCREAAPTANCLSDPADLAWGLAAALAGQDVGIAAQDLDKVLQIVRQVGVEMEPRNEEARPMGCREAIVAAIGPEASAWGDPIFRRQLRRAISAGWPHQTATRTADRNERGRSLYRLQDGSLGWIDPRSSAALAQPRAITFIEALEGGELFGITAIDHAEATLP